MIQTPILAELKQRIRQMRPDEIESLASDKSALSKMVLAEPELESLLKEVTKNSKEIKSIACKPPLTSINRIYRIKH
jgi:hypothetical protein